MGRAAVRERAERIAQGSALPKMTEPCASCGEKCCNRFAVPVTGFDVARILERLGGKPEEFAHLAVAEHIQNAPHAGVFIFDKEGRMEERLLTLRRMKTNYCIFSRHSDGCAIWGYHPMACRAYPFAFGEEGRIGYTKNLVCPRNWEKGEYDEKKVLAILKQTQDEMDEYNKMVRAWNANHAKKAGKAGAGEERFWEFLLKESGKRMREWKTLGAADSGAMGSLGPKRGYIERE